MRPEAGHLKSERLEMVQKIVLDTAPRILLGAIFLFFGIDGYVFVFTGGNIVTPPVSEAGNAFVTALQASGFFWPFMKGIFIIGGLMLLLNRAPALALALLAPGMSIIVLFHFVLNPGGIPIAIILIVLGSLVLINNREKFKPLLSQA